MKRALSFFLILAILLSFLLTQVNATSTSDLTFTLNDDGASYSVTDCNTSASGSLTIPDTYNGKPVTSIGHLAFYDCWLLTSITIPDSVKTIGEDAFYSCSYLASITIPDSVTSIGIMAFRYCRSLTSITIPNSVTSIGKGAFYDCVKLASIWVDADNPAYSSDDKGVLFNKNKTELIQAPEALTGSYVIPNSVTSIDNWAFRCCRSLTSVIIGNSVTRIGENSFYACENLVYVVLSNSVITVELEAFRLSSNLKIIWYIGSIADSGNMSIGDGNNYLKNAEWHYDCICFNGHVYLGDSDMSCEICEFIRNCINHTYSYVCDATCDECGYIRKTHHTYDSDCDEQCNICGESRAVEHVYNDACDTSCNLCGKTRWVLHNYEWIIDQQENCGKNGVKHEECSICFSKRNENTQIAATGNHTFTDGNDIECNVCKQGFVLIQFNSNGGTSLSSIRTLPNQTTALHTAVPTRAGYNFVGWSTTKAGNALYQAGDSLQTDKSITLYAQWNKHCDSCSGTGKTKCNSCSGVGTKEVTETCPNCNGGKYCFACCSRWTYYTGWNIIRYCGGYTLNNDRDTYYVKKLTCPYCGRGFKVPDYMANRGINKSEIGPIIDGLIAYNILLECEVCSGIGNIYSRVQCSKCDGSRQAECSACAGSGEATRTNVSAPAAPTLKSVTANTVTLKAITNGEYSVGGDVWQESPTFDNLEAGQVYRFYQRYKKTDTTYASYSSIALTVLVHEHTFDNACDTNCDLCGITRETTHNFEWIIDQQESCGENGIKHEECSVCHATQNTGTVIQATGNHLYENNCDAACNVCGQVRTVADHVYDNVCDTTCNICRYIRQVSPHFVRESVEEHVLTNSTTYPFTLSDGWYSSTNKSDSTSSTFTLTTKHDCELTVFYKVSSERNYDKLIIKQNSTTLATASGAVSEKSLTVTLVAGDILTFTYSKDGSQSSGSDVAQFKLGTCDCDTYVEAESVAPSCVHPIVCAGCGLEIKPISTVHTYDNVCDTTCNKCGFVRTAPHEYDHACDTTCNECGYVRAVPDHVYDDEKDRECNECGYVAYISGDLTGDDKINSLDGLLLMRYLNGWNVNIASPEAMDVNGDGKVNSLDGLILMRYLNGWNVTLG